MHVNFSELVDFCFNDLSNEKKRKVELKIFSDENYLLMIRGINLAKKELGSKEKVISYFSEQFPHGVREFAF